MSENKTFSYLKKNIVEELRERFYAGNGGSLITFDPVSQQSKLPYHYFNKSHYFVQIKLCIGGSRGRRRRAAPLPKGIDSFALTYQIF